MKNLLIFTLLYVLLPSCSAQKKEDKTADKKLSQVEENKIDTITLGAGCFWCVEAIFAETMGVVSVKSGYSGGEIKNPSYKEVCTGRTGHAEVVQVAYDTSVISLQDILEIFWQTHDPTTLNRQGADVGTQYRSAIFYHNDEQKEIAKEIKSRLDSSGAWDNPIVTEISAFDTFYEAEDYHQDYFAENGDQPYCRAVIRPKLEKYRKAFKDKLK